MWFGEHCQYSRTDGAGRKFLDVNRENLQADYPSVFGPDVKEVKTPLSISLKAS